MPRRKYYGRKKRRYYRRYKRPNLTQKIKKTIQSMAEKKVQTQFADTTVDSVGTFIPAGSIAEGDRNDERTGDQVSITSTHFCGIFAVADAYNFLRVILFEWESATAPSNAVEILESTSSHSIISEYQLDRPTPFRVLQDKTYRVDTDDPAKKVFIKHKFRNPMKVSYDNTGATDYGARSLWWLIISDSGAVSHPAITYRVVTRYIDL